MLGKLGRIDEGSIGGEEGAGAGPSGIVGAEYGTEASRVTVAVIVDVEESVKVVKGAPTKTQVFGSEPHV